MNFLIEISYDGSKFYGFQRLNEHLSVQKALEDALFIINKKEVLVKGAGRTDRGVHAYGQCVTFKLDVNIDEDGLTDKSYSFKYLVNQPYAFLSRGDFSVT